MKKRVIVLMIVTFLIIFLYYQNNGLMVTTIEVRDERIPRNFDGYTILHLSDLHNKSFGKNQSKLIAKIEEAAPHMIVITGDFIDRRRYNETPSLQLIDELKGKYPIYFVTGNHEGWSGKWEGLKKRLEERNVKVLEGEKIEINEGNERFFLIGVEDPAKYTKDYFETEAYFDAQLKETTTNLKEDDFSILLAHRPEKFPLYKEYNIGLTLSGHAHGGQIRIPFIGAIIAPGQGFFPKYTEGIYEEKNSKMIVSRGLGSSLIPLRLFNRPEVVVVKLKSEK